MMRLLKTVEAILAWWVLCCGVLFLQTWRALLLFILIGGRFLVSWSVPLLLMHVAWLFRLMALSFIWLVPRDWYRYVDVPS